MGVVATANRSAAALSQSVTAPFADPFIGLEGRNLRDGAVILKSFLPVNFFGVLFFEVRRMLCNGFGEPELSTLPQRPFGLETQSFVKRDCASVLFVRIKTNLAATSGDGTCDCELNKILDHFSRPE